MARFWLTPLRREPAPLLGAERLCCQPGQELDRFREQLGLLHPRLLPMFKSSLLLSDDTEACGSEEWELNLADGAAIVFDGQPYELSHCGEAFFDRLLPQAEARALLQGAAFAAMEWSQAQLDWRDRWIAWLANDFDVILLRED